MPYTRMAISLRCIATGEGHVIFNEDHALKIASANKWDKRNFG
jgi:hypothetical protein